MADIFYQGRTAVAGFAQCFGAELLQGDERRAEQRKSRRLENLHALASGAYGCAVSLYCIRERKFRILREDASRPAGTATALEALHGRRGRRSGRSARASLCREIF